MMAIPFLKKIFEEKQILQYRGSKTLYRIGNFIMQDVLWFLPSIMTFPTPYGKFRRRKSIRALSCMLDVMEPQASPFLERSLKNSECFVDVGAECGWYCLKAARIMDQPKILAIEPNPANFQILQYNISLNKLEKVVILERKALSDKEGEIYLEGYKVKTQTLDSLLKFHKLNGRKLTIKIDVEGQAGMVLRGMEETLESGPHLIIELHGKEERNEVLKCLKKAKHSYIIKELPGDMLIAF